MKRYEPLLFLLAVVGAVVALILCGGVGGCAAPTILGGPTPDTTTHRCENGTVCPNGVGCPPLAGGPCQGTDDTDVGPGDPYSVTNPTWRRARDAGADAR